MQFVQVPAGQQQSGRPPGLATGAATGVAVATDAGTTRQPHTPVRPIAISATTNITPSATQDGFSVHRRNTDGSQVVVNSHVQSNGQRNVVAYQVTQNQQAGTQTQLFMDGRRTVVGRDFVTRSVPHQPTVTTSRTACARRPCRAADRCTGKTSPSGPAATAASGG